MPRRPGEGGEAGREVACCEAHAHKDRCSGEAVDADRYRLGEEQLRPAHGTAENRFQGARRHFAGHRVPGDERHDERQQDEGGEGERDERDHEPVLQ
jgi:hypothetical protein